MSQYSLIASSELDVESPTTTAPDARPDFNPLKLSSNTRHSSGFAPNRCAPLM